MTTQPVFPSPSSSSFAHDSWTYDVFLNFRGADTRTTFTDHLRNALVGKGIHTFIDDDELQRGEEIKPALVKAIEDSRISVIVFSENYASSRWCLDELVEILRCKQSKQQIVFPIFYKVDPSDVRHQRSKFGDAFDGLIKNKFKDDKEKVIQNKWRKALTEAANLSGWHFAEGAYEATFINSIVDGILSQVLSRTYLNVAKYPVGIRSHVQDVEMLLDVGGNGRHMVGIWGTSGIGKTTIAKAIFNADSKHGFNSSESDWGFTSFMALSELCDSNKGFLRNDKCIITADVSVRKVDIRILEDQGTGSSATIEPSEQEDQGQEPSSVDSVQVPHSSVTTHSSEQVVAFQDAPSSRQVFIEPTDSYVDPSIVKEHDKVPFTPVGKLVDFRGLGKIEKVFVPLLEEVCSWHPSLVECQKKRSRTFIEWAFTALGRVLHFLKTTKVKDMTEDACEHLQILWEELETFKFDLAWLEPSVQTALNLKKLVERAGKVQKQREDMDALEIEVKRLKARLAVAEIDLEVAKRDLAKAAVGFGNDTDMNRELGYGRH